MEKQLLNVKAVFDHALEIESPIERVAYLDEACAGAPEVRQQVAALLKAHADAGNFLESPPAANLPSPPWGRWAGGEGVLPTADEPLSERPGTVIGPYKLMEQIGEGGMGLVFVAGLCR